MARADGLSEQRVKQSDFGQLTRSEHMMANTECPQFRSSPWLLGLGASGCGFGAWG